MLRCIGRAARPQQLLQFQTTAQVIVLSVLGALLMYGTSLISLFVLRRKEPELARPFAVPGYPYVPLPPLALTGLSLGYNPLLSGIFLAGLLGLLALYKAVRG